jgi:orotate phosphoribosyltransferase
MLSKNGLILLLKSCGAVEFGKFRLKSGRESHFYFDLSKVCLHSTVSAIANQIMGYLKESHIAYDAIGGPELGSVSLTGALLALHTLTAEHGWVRGFAVRKEAKDHGKPHLITGSVQVGDRCVLVEDVSTTGGSLLKAIDEIQKFGCHVVHAFVIVDRTGEIGPILQDRQIPFTALLGPQDFDFQ